MREVAWVIFDEIHYMRDKGTCINYYVSEASLENPLWNKLPPALRQISDPSYELMKTSPLAIPPQLFHSKLKTLQILS